MTKHAKETWLLNISTLKFSLFRNITNTLCFTNYFLSTPFRNSLRNEYFSLLCMEYFCTSIFWGFYFIYCLIWMQYYSLYSCTLILKCILCSSNLLSIIYFSDCAWILYCIFLLNQNHVLTALFLDTCSKRTGTEFSEAKP